MKIDVIILFPVCCPHYTYDSTKPNLSVKCEMCLTCVTLYKCIIALTVEYKSM